MSAEFDKIGRLAERFARPAAKGVIVGIGDDAAVLETPRAGRIVWTVDEQVEGIHFRREWLSWQDLGWRSFMAAASDLAAMASEPWCALAALSLPRALDDAALDALGEGQRAAAEAVGAPIVGGNLACAEVVSVTTTLLGTCERAALRRGARAGDGVWVAGSVGLAAAGMRALAAGVTDSRVEPAVLAWRRPAARIAEGRAMALIAHAAIDVSDGLSQDVAHLAEASGVGVVLDERALRAHVGDVLARAAEAVGADPLELALTGGEDYALVAVSDVPLVGFARVGEVREGSGVSLRTESSGGTEERLLDPRGFDHFAR